MTASTANNGSNPNLDPTNPNVSENKDLQNSSSLPDGQTDPKQDKGNNAPSTDPKDTPVADPKNSEPKKVKDVKIKCQYSTVRIGKEYFSPDHEGNITVPSNLAEEAKKVCGA